MKVLIQRSKVFRQIVNTGIKTKDAAGNEVFAQKQQRHFAPQSALPQEIPDWCREDLTFKVGIADRSIIDLTPVVQTLPADIAATVAKATALDAPNGETAGDDAGLADSGESGKKGKGK